MNYAYLKRLYDKRAELEAKLELHDGFASYERDCPLA